MFGELVRRTRKNHKAVLLEQKHGHSCFVSDSKININAYRCCSSGQFIKKTPDFEQNVTTCKKELNIIFRKLCINCENHLSGKLASLSMSYANVQKLFKDMEIFDFESICVQEDQFRDSDTATWIGMRVPISRPIFSNLNEQRTF